ncbi:MAG: bifunctional diaminohydroxyphosphoribosylaminopyrimidine deaminase/5-amino-6-(5-phosphoribosylamino)uracil reductase RibD [Nitrospinota bacterium]
MPLGICGIVCHPDALEVSGIFFGMVQDHERCMRRALELAEGGRGRTSPNPMVGAVLLKEGRLVGEGFHARAGEPHAEVGALRAAGPKAAGATLYVTLEPCVHHGRTPPCVEAILEARVARVVIGMHDVNPSVAGRGVRRLVEAGVAVEVGVLGEECRRLNAPYETWMVERRPFVCLKAAASLDGKIATYRGASRWISTEASRRRVHALRNEMDAVMVGAGTVVRDDPALTVRLVDGEVRQPARIVVDSTLRIPLTSRLLSERPEVATLVATTGKAPPERREAIEAVGREVLVLPERAGRVDLTALMATLAGRAVVSLLLEGGGQLNAAMLEAGLVDKVLVVVAPMLIGGREARTVLDGLGADSIEEAWQLTDLHVEDVEGDLHIEASVVRRR